MNMKLIKRKSWADESGVSEIVGNILILMITVVLFSGIMMFVNQMPVPELTTKADFSANVQFDNLGTTANLTITHIGGAVMIPRDTLIIVSVDDVTYAERLSEDVNFTHSEWATGIEWKKHIEGTSESSSISVTIVDDISHNAVWISQVSGGVGGNPPTILQRYMDSNIETPSADPIKDGDLGYSFFVRVTDINNDLDSSTSGVWINSSAIDGQVVNDYDYADGGWFRWDFGAGYSDADTFDGATLVIHARDTAGHETVSSYKVAIYVLPSDTVFISSELDPGEGGMPSYIKNINEGQGFGVFAENKTNLGRADTSNATTVFVRGERVFVRVASIYISNVFGYNDLKLVDTRNNIDYTSSLVFETDYFQSTFLDPFYAIAYGGNVYLYQAVFNTTNLMPGSYTMTILLKASGTSNYIYTAEVSLYITDPDSPVSYFPEVWLFKDTGYSQDWGSTKTAAFNATGLNSKLYVAIRVQDAQASPAPSVGEIRISDMTGGIELYGPPNSGSMIGSVTQSGTNATAYVFWIDLRLNNGDNWKAGTNSYTIHIAQFSDNNEGVYAYSEQVFIRASTSKMDFMIGTEGIYSSKGGSTNFINPEYIYYVENNNFFTTRLIHLQENAPSTAPLYYHNAMALGDLDGDGDLDLLAGTNMDKTGSSYSDFGQLLYFENTMNTYGVWQSPSYITRPPTEDDTEAKIEWIDIGDIDGDGDMDFAYSAYKSSTPTSHKVFIYNNTYGAGGKLFASYNSTTSPPTGGVRKIALEDMTGDGCDDLIVLAEGRVKMYDLTKWTRGLFATFPNTSVACNIIDFDIADVNDDGMLDIITVDPETLGGSTWTSHTYMKGVWVNNYTENPNPTIKTVDVTQPVYQFAGRVTGGDVVATTSDSDSDAAYSLAENTTGDEAGMVSFVLRMQSPLAADTDAQLVVRAKTSLGAQEVFYIWYSTDTNPVTAKFTPVMVVSGSSYTTYTYPLPDSVAGATYFWVNITDSSRQLGLATEQIDLEYIAIESNRFGSYWPSTSPTPTSRYQVTGTTGTHQDYTTARAIDFDGTGDDHHLEVVVAKNAKWMVYDYKTPIGGQWAVENETNFHVIPAGLSTYVVISPTLFEVADLNGDGLEDILTVWVTTGASDEESLLKVYLNVDPTFKWEVDVKDVFSGMLVGTETGSIVSILAADIYGR